MKNLIALLGVGVIALAANVAYAGEACCKSKKAEATASSACCKDKAEAGAACCKSKGGDATAAASCKDKSQAVASASCCAKKGSASDNCMTSSMPRVAYKIGDKTLSCPDAAKELLAANSDAKMVYVVADKEYAEEADAQKAYSVVLTSYFDNMLKVQEVAATDAKTCPVTGKTIAPASKGAYKLASYEFGCPSDAEKAAKLARAEAEKVTMKMVVDGKEYGCPVSAKAACDGKDKKVEYVVGETKTCCDVLASVELAKARIAVAEKVIAQAATQSHAS